MINTSNLSILEITLNEQRLVQEQISKALDSEFPDRELTKIVLNQSEQIINLNIKLKIVENELTELCERL